ncbi:hypothetical protein Tsubulata_014366 [Turnera subulata]|uniref:ATP-dependent Clp protease proteolytic subunit n=1 Tax=Turnera subulata TaxID=218843 RepID=A0A9Q0F791_9ROSI|nr:hypothetical protein Tsubulata_014366 [Turnera subulata]
MATSWLLSPLSASITPELVGYSSGLHLKSTLLSNTNNLLLLTNRRTSRRRPLAAKHTISASYSNSPDDIPKRFRAENLPDGLMENYKNVPQSLYGLTASQLHMFVTENNPFQRLSASITPESISSKKSYSESLGFHSLSQIKAQSTNAISGATMMAGGRGRYSRPRRLPPDLPSLLLNSRIIYIAMPIVPEVTELIMAQFIYLEYTDTSRPIYLYLNSHGTQNEKMQIVGSETGAYAIADAITGCEAEVHTVNMGWAFGQAAMLLSLGAKGHRAILPHARTKLYLPSVYRSSGAAVDMWIRAEDTFATTDIYIELLAEGTGKAKEELLKDAQETKYFTAQEAIDYGLADKIFDSKSIPFEETDPLAAYKSLLEASGGKASGGNSPFAPLK